MSRNLIYTIALDYPGTTGHRNLAKMLVSSLLRTRFSGDIVVLHNSPAPLFMVARAGVGEIAVDLPESAVANGDLALFARSCKHLAAARLDAASYDKVMFIDCDSVALRNVDHLLAGEWELAFFGEFGTKIQEPAYGAYLSTGERQSLRREGINSGTWAVSGARFGELIRRWGALEAKVTEHLDGFREQCAFNRVVLDWEGRLHPWPRREIALPLCNHDLSRYQGYMQAAVVHAASGYDVDYKLRFLFSTFAGKFLFDPQLTLFNILEM